MIGNYLDFQSVVGITKHMGGIGASRELLALCHVDQAREVLEVGCGIGVGPANLARDAGCRVVGVDRSQRMIEWAERRAREHGVEDRVALLVADATSLPFEDGRFDIAYAESVLGFVPDKGQALAEMVRVTRPGGYVGINETIWTRPMPPEVARIAADMGVDVLPPDTWQALCEAAGLRDVTLRLRRVDAAAELRNRIRWVGLPWALRAMGRTARMYATEPETRARFKAFMGTGARTFEAAGYGLFVGRVASAA
jgi:SAM-dependent methyltransferase